MVLFSPDVKVAAKIFTPGIFWRSSATPFWYPSETVSTVAFAAPKSLMPSIQITVVTPGRLTISRSRRERAEGPPANGLADV